MPSAAAEAPLVAVQLVTWNGADYLAECLASLDAQTFRRWRLWLLDNHSGDATPLIAARWCADHPGAAYRQLPSNTGFAHGHNALLADHRLPYVAVLNQDTRLSPRYLAELVAYLEARATIGSASGYLLRWEVGSQRTELNDQNSKAMRTMDSAGLKIFLTHRVVERGRGEPIWPSGPAEAVFGVPATAALYRRKALDDVCLILDDGRREWFDEDFGSYKEDVDLAYRLALFGWESAVVPNARAWHVRTLRGAADAAAALGTFATLRHRRRKAAADNARSYRNHLLFLLKSCACSPLSLSWWATLGYELAKFAIIALTEPRTLVGGMPAWPLLRKMRAKRRLMRQKPSHPERVRRWMSWAATPRTSFRQHFDSPM